MNSKAKRETLDAYRKLSILKTYVPQQLKLLTPKDAKTIHRFKSPTPKNAWAETLKLQAKEDSILRKEGVGMGDIKQLRRSLSASSNILFGESTRKRTTGMMSNASMRTVENISEGKATKNMGLQEIKERIKKRRKKKAALNK
jgi:hypothetical protein